MPTLTDVRQLLDSITACGVRPPEQLTSLLESYDAVATPGAAPPATDQLAKDVLDNRLRGRELDKAIAAADAAQRVIEFRQKLQTRIETAMLHRFTQELQRGGADQVIDLLSPAFDKAAAALAKAGELIGPDVDPVSFLEKADDAERAVWSSIGPNLKTVEQVAAVVTQFGTKSLSGFSMITLPAGVGPTAWLSDAALLCVDAKFDLEASSAAFNRPGVGKGITLVPRGRHVEAQLHQRGG